MQISPEYIKKILHALEESTTAISNLSEIVAAVTDNNDLDDAFIIHYLALMDQGFIVGTNPNAPITINPKHSETGLITEDGNGGWLWNDINLRMTAKGHEFITAMEKSEVWEVIKKDFKNESLQTISAVAKDLAVGFAKQKLGKYLDK